MPTDSAPALPADARRTLRLYNFCFPFVFLALLPGFLARLFRRGGFHEKFGQRLGLFSAADRRRLSRAHPVWVHSISVGETLVALKLVREIQKADPEAQIVLSTTTSTGFALAREAQGERLEAAYNPIDFLPVVKRALDAIRPRMLVLIEGEAWPNLLAECFRRSIPVVLANARLSPRSAGRFERFRTWTGPIFRLLQTVCVADSDDAARWQRLGVSPEKIHTTGNMKFDQNAGASSRTEEFRALLAPLGVARETPILIAGSTHAGEERLIAEIYLRLRREFPELFLIIVPRHVERTAGIVRELAPVGLSIIQRSTLPASAEPGGILLVDTTGELRDWYAAATVAFIGKSFTAGGGQNPAEPAALGKPVVFGLHMENFAAVADLLVECGAASRAADAAALEAELRLLLSDPSLRVRRGAAAKTALAGHAGATERTLKIIQQLPSAPQNP